MSSRAALVLASLALLHSSVASAQGVGERGRRACRDRVDNDNDGYYDCYDNECQVYNFCAAYRAQVQVTAPAPAGPVAAAPPSRYAQGGVVVGYVFDFTGYFFLLLGGGLAGADVPLPVWASMIWGSTVPSMIGALVSSASLSARQRAYERAGYWVNPGPRAGAWVATSIVLALGAAAFGVGIPATINDDFGLSMASLGLSLGCAVTEAFNWLLGRRRWNAALANARPTGQ